MYQLTGLTYRTQVTFKSVEEQARAKLVRDRLVAFSNAEFSPRTKEEVDKKFESMLLEAGRVPCVRVTKAKLIEQTQAEEASMALLALAGFVDFRSGSGVSENYCSEDEDISEG